MENNGHNWVRFTDPIDVIYEESYYCSICNIKIWRNTRTNQTFNYSKQPDYRFMTCKDFIIKNIIE